MKNLLYIPLILLVFSSCQKKITEFDIDFTNQVTIPATFNSAVPIALATPETQTNSDTEFESNNAHKDKVKNVHLRELTLTITNPSEETFSFLNEIEISLENDNYAKTLIAHKRNIPNSIGAIITCDLEDEDLQDFIKDDSFRIIIDAVSDETIPENIDIDIFSQYRVNLSLGLFN